MLFVDNGDSASAGNGGTFVDNWETFNVWHLNQLPTQSLLRLGLPPLKRSGKSTKDVCYSETDIFIYNVPHPVLLLLDWLIKKNPQFLCSYGGIEFTVYV